MGYEGRAPAVEPLPASTKVTGVVSPHIDYERGWQTYAQLWGRCSGALDDVELAIILGTDHKGGPGALTLTRQSYASPLGTLPTDREVVDGLAGVIGEGEAFEEEIHHLSEHSIELAAVWFQRVIGREVPAVPILCGSMFEVVAGGDEVEGYGRLDDAIGYLEGVMRERRTLVIAAGDLAHVGPAFGDPSPVSAQGRASLGAADARTIAAIDEGRRAGLPGHIAGRARRPQDLRHCAHLHRAQAAPRLAGRVAGLRTVSGRLGRRLAGVHRRVDTVGGRRIGTSAGVGRR